MAWASAWRPRVPAAPFMAIDKGNEKVTSPPNLNFQRLLTMPLLAPYSAWSVWLCPEYAKLHLTCVDYSQGSAHSLGRFSHQNKFDLELQSFSRGVNDSSLAYNFSLSHNQGSILINATM